MLGIETKYIVFGAALLLGVPIGIVVAYLSQKILDAVFVLMVVATSFPTGNTDIELITRDWYRGTTRGLEVNIVDLCGLVVFGAVLLRRMIKGSRWQWPPSLGFIVVYFLYCALSVALSDPWLFGAFELTKVFRGLFLFVVVFYFIETDRERRLLLFAICAATLYVSYYSLDQRFIGGLWRIGGPMGHPNMLSIYSCLVAPILFSCALARENTFKQRALYGFSSGMAVVNVLLTVSRTGFAVICILMAGISLLSLPRMSKKYRKYAWLGMIVMGMGLVLGSGNVLWRMDVSQGQFDNSAVGDRQVYWTLLSGVIEDTRTFWIGGGLNNWSYVTSTMLGTVFEGIDEEPIGHMQPPAHSIVVLTIGELGIIGLLIFMAMWGRWLAVGVSFLFKRSDTLIATMGLGGMFGLSGVFMQCVTEWAFRASSTYLLSHIVLAGMMASYVSWKRQLR
jgi:hypothetical protein